MKKFIRTIYCGTEDEADNIKHTLIDSGFYVLSFGSALEVYAIEPRVYVEDKILNLVKNLFK